MRNNQWLILFKKVQSFTETVTALALVFMILVVLLQTFTRFVVFYSLPWSEELSRYLFVVMILMGFNIAVSRDELIRISVIDGFVRGKSAAVLIWVRLFLSLFVNVMFAYSSYELISIGLYQLSPAMQIPMYLIYVVIFTGFLLSLIALLIESVSILTNGENLNNQEMDG